MKEKVFKSIIPKLPSKKDKILHSGLTMKKSIRCIARELHRSLSTISCEIHRNFCNIHYKTLCAQKESDNRKCNANKRQWLKALKLCHAVINMLVNERFSPETIAGRLRRLYPLDKSMWTNYESIYE